MPTPANHTEAANTQETRTVQATRPGCAPAAQYFPRGLFQPEGSFRFSLDALLLGCFAHQAFRQWSGQSGQTASRLLDLGCGCGVVAFTIMLREDGFSAFGVDMQPQLVQAASLNAARLGLHERFEGACLDLEQVFPANTNAGPIVPPTRAKQEPFSGPSPLHCQQHGFGLITANPPYRLNGAGRLPESPSRRAALFGGRENLGAFVRAGAYFLSPNGVFCLIFPWERLKELQAVLEAHGLTVRQLLPVRNRAGQPPKRVLLTAMRAGYTGSQPIALSGAPCAPESLTLYEGSGGAARLSREAVSFCPPLHGKVS